MSRGKKIFEIAKQILRWIWRVILSLLFIAGVVFQAPLKVLILAAIFLLACTALPLRFRKWFWAGVGIVVLVLLIWVFLPENDEGWKPYTFDEELANLEAKYKVPDEENAAVIYNKLIADYNKSDFEPNFINDKIDGIISDEYWSPKDYPQVAEWMNSHKELMNKLLEASVFEECKFPLKQKGIFDLNLDRLSAFRNWARLLSRSSNNDIFEGRIDEGIEKIRAVAQLGKHIEQQGLLINLLVGIAIESISLNRCEKIAIDGDINQAQQNEIEAIVNTIEFDFEKDFASALDYEKMYMKNMLASCIYEKNAKGNVRLSRGPDKAIANLYDDECTPKINYLAKKLVKAYSILYWFFVPANPHEFSKIIDSVNQKNYEMADLNFDWSKEPTEFSLSSFKLNYKFLIEMLTRIEGPLYFKIHDLYLRGESGKNGALLIIALRRYKDKNGTWPENLDEVQGLTNEENFTDPVNDQLFVYKLADDGFVLYSKGENGVDDDGERFSEYCGGTNVKKTADDIMIWPSKKRQKESPKETSGEPNDIKGEQK